MTTPSTRFETRQVREIATVRRAALGVLLLASPAWFAALDGVRVVAASVAGTPGAFAVVGGALVAFGVTVAGWSHPSARTAASIGTALAGVACAFLPGIPVAAVAATLGLVACGTLVRASADAVPASLRSAATGWTSAACAAGAVPAVLAASEGRAWLTVFCVAGALAARAASNSAAADHERSAARAAARADAPLLSVDDLTVVFRGPGGSSAGALIPGGVVALDRVSFALRPGEVVALLGTNGAGKTTLLKTIAGLVRPSGGTVRVDGIDVTGLLPEELAIAGVTYVDGSKPVFPDMTVHENLRLAAAWGGRASGRASESKATTASSGARFGLRASGRASESNWPIGTLAARRHALAGTLSGGEQRLLALAQTLAWRPRVLLADELTLGLDAEAVADLHDAVRALAEGGTAVVVVEHRLEYAADVASRVVFLDGARVAYEGPPAGLEARDDLIRPVLLTGGGA